MTSLVPIIQELRWRLPPLIVLCLLATICDGIGIALFMPLLKALNFGPQSPTTQLSSNGIFDQLGVPANPATVLALLLCVFLLKGAVKFLESAAISKERQRLSKAMRKRFLTAFRNADYLFISKQDSGSILHLAGAETNQAIHFTFNGVSAIAHIFSVFAYFLMAVFVDWRFTVCTAALALLPAKIMASINKKSKLASASLSKANTEFQRRQTEFVQNFKYLRATNASAKFANILEKHIDELGYRIFRLGLLSAWAQGLKDPLLITTLGSIILAHLAVGAAGIQEVVFILLILYRSMGQLMSLQVSWQAYLAHSGSIELVQEKIRHIENNAEQDGSIKLPEGPIELDFQNVSLKMGDQRILNEICLRVNPGSTIAILGPSGAGKSSLVNLVCGLLKPTKGTLLVNGAEVTQLSYENYRKRIGYVTQENALFNDTVYNNLNLWPDEFIQKNSEAERLLRFVEELPRGLLQEIGDRGLRLSGGQRQRLCIGRELLKEIDLLILDEALSALDPLNEYLIMESLLDLKGKTTVIIITHQLKPAEFADNIAIIENGSLLEYGNSQSLMNNPKSHIHRYRNR